MINYCGGPCVTGGTGTGLEASTNSIEFIEFWKFARFCAIGAFDVETIWLARSPVLVTPNVFDNFSINRSLMPASLSEFMHSKFFL